MHPQDLIAIGVKKIKEFLVKFQKKILEKYFFNNPIPVFKNDGWGDLQIVPSIKEIHILSPNLTSRWLF